MGPSTWTQLLITGLFVLPGFVCRGVRARLRGPHPDDRELPVRVFRALAVSAAFALAYVVVLGPRVSATVADPRLLLASPRGYAVTALVLVFVLPALVGIAAHVRTLVRAGVTEHWWQLRPDDLTRYDTTPTAWDFSFQNREERQFVRVLTADNLWLGGLADEHAFSSAYPERRELYLAVAYHLHDDGSFGEEVENSAGMWINCEDAKLVQFIRTVAEARDEPAPVGQTEPGGR